MLKNMVAVVTGAVNGLGRETVSRLCKESAVVLGCDIRDDNGELKNTFGDSVEFLKADVRKEEDLEEVFRRTKDKFGRVDILVNCAGFSVAHTTCTGSGKPFELDHFSRMLEVNICGQFNAIRLAAKEMACNAPSEEGQKGVIILTSGFAGRTSRRGQAAISAACGGIESMTLPLSRELGSLGIRVATISPGLFKTPLTASFDSKTVEFLNRCITFPYRFGEPVEYADLVLQIIQNK